MLKKMFMGIINTELKIVDFSRDNGREGVLIVSIRFNSSMKIKILSKQIRNDVTL